MPYPAKLGPEQILDAAETLLEESGPEGFSMRSLASALDVRASSLYRHFESQTALYAGLGDRAALAMREQLLKAAEGLKPRAGVAAAAQAYLDFARMHPHLYALLLIHDPGVTAEQLAVSAGKQLWNALLLLVGRLSGNPDDTDQTVALWTFLHGFVTLEASGIYGKSGPKGGFEVGLKALLDHMEQSPTISDAES